MGYQIRQQRNGQWCVWSSYCEDFLKREMDEQEAIDYYVELARQRAIEAAKLWIKQSKELRKKEERWI